MPTPWRTSGRPFFGRHAGRAILAAGLLLTLGAPRPPAAAQDREASRTDDWASGAFGEAGFLSVNAVLGGLTGGVLQTVRGGSFPDGFARGSLGGAVGYAGKRLAAESFPSAGFLGRQVAAVGASVVRNAAEARPSLETLVLPIGPLRVRVRPAEGPAPRLRLDLFEAYWVVYGIAESRLAFEAGESLSSGAPVFRARGLEFRSGGRRALGLTTGGVVFLAGDAGSATLAHEVVHVIQHDFAKRAWTEPLDDWLLGHLPAGGLRDHVSLDLTLHGARFGLGQIIGPAVDAPWEAEARFLGGR